MYKYMSDLFDMKKITNYIRKYRINSSENTSRDMGVTVILEDSW